MPVDDKRVWFGFDRKLRARFIRYCATGGLNTLVDFVVFAALIGIFRLVPFSANLLAFAVAAMCSFVLNRNWTFRDRVVSELSRSRSAWQFVVFMLCMSSTALFCSWLLEHLVELGSTIAAAKVGVTVMSMVINYLLMNRVIFMQRKRM